MHPSQSEQTIIQPPTGTVTFLFTDIEGSTRLWEVEKDAMGLALAKHDSLLRQIIDGNGGYIFKTVGDSFCSAFRTAREALLAAVTIQRALQEEDWDTRQPIQVRMAIHTGAVEFRYMDYFGQPLNRVSRLVSAANGGQTLLSLATTELVRDMLPEDVSLRDLGEHRLKDLVRPEHIYQVICEGAANPTTPIRTLGDHKHNLPFQLTSFVGREIAMAEVSTILRANRLVTLTGTGGAGKTRLSLQVAADLLERFTDGVWFVELAALTSEAEILAAVAHVLGIHEQQENSLLETILHSLKSKSLLLILDNCEHLVSECAIFVNHISRQCPTISIIATSRERLGIPGEQVYRVPSLSLPPDPTANANHGNTQRKFSADQLTQYEAVRLFIDRALLSNPNFTVDDENAPALASLCAQLDGIPLALELAAARCRALSLREIHARLKDRFRLLTGGSRSLLPRQQTLRALVDWSYDLLSENEKQFLMRLSVFAGSFSYDPVEEICFPPSEDLQNDPLDLLTSLLDKSLVIAEDSSNEMRYRMLQTIRDYAADRLAESGHTEVVRIRHANFFSEVAAKGHDGVYSKSQQEWLDRLDLELDNIRAALNTFLQQGDTHGMGMDMCSNLYRFWWIRCYWRESKAWCEKFVSIHRNRPASFIKARGILNFGHIVLNQGHYDEARANYESTLQMLLDLGQTELIGHTTHCLAHVYQLEGRLTEARPLYEESLAFKRTHTDLFSQTMTMNNLANVLMDMGELDGARKLHEEALEIRRTLEAPQAIAQTLHNLGNVVFARSEYEMAKKYLREAAKVNLTLQDTHSLALTLQSFGDIAAKTGYPNSAAVIWGASDGLRQLVGAPTYAHDRERHQAEFKRIENLIGQETFRSAWERGMHLSVNEAADFATEPWSE